MPFRKVQISLGNFLTSLCNFCVSFSDSFSFSCLILAVIFSVVACSLESNCSVIVKISDLKFEHSAWNFELFVSVAVTMLVLKVERALVSRSCSCLADIPTPTSVATILSALLSSNLT